MSFCLRLIVWFYLESSGQNSNDHMVASRSFSWWWIKDKMGGTRVRVCDCYVLRICIFTFHSSISNMKKKKERTRWLTRLLLWKCILYIRGNLLQWMLMLFPDSCNLSTEKVTTCCVAAELLQVLFILWLYCRLWPRGIRRDLVFYFASCVFWVFMSCVSALPFFNFFIKDKNVKTKSRWRISQSSDNHFHN